MAAPCQFLIIHQRRVSKHKEPLKLLYLDIFDKRRFEAPATEWKMKVQISLDMMHTMFSLGKSKISAKASNINEKHY